ncbi:MAG TPA: alpha/beta fold hydrolase [Brevundimonas sp.]|uniref:alpha/beta hydrolase n=1 Tax=Brevundimonas sp. TaxID=1871086 RepID=UPI002618669C|nr:alpha/beta fold hydrolase [Brevundimonas sp.]HRO33986.1 alpha/beta fold hydrolase [Brevundimonas sp.]
MNISALHRRTFITGAGLAVAACGPSGRSSGLLNLEKTFTFEGPQGQQVQAERSFFEVPEDRRDPRSRKIRLGYVRFRSTSSNPGAPIVYLAGGPGGSATAAAAGPRFPIFMALRDVADVIAFDQRGTGLSRHLPELSRSPAPFPPLTREGMTAYMREEIQRAWSEWNDQGVLLAGYDTEQSADDVDALRRHLGAEKIDVWGISYGTHLALSVLKRHGRHVGRVALASLEGQDQTVKLPSRLDAYFERVDALVASDPELRSTVPSLPALMRRVHARLEENPVDLTLPVGGSPAPVRVGGFVVQLLAGGLVANPDTLSLLPALYAALDSGQPEVLTYFMRDAGAWLRVSGMTEAMDLASGISAARLRQVEQEAPTSVLGDALNFPMPHIAGAVLGVDLGDSFRAPISIEHPALLISGNLDGRTPLEEQEDVASQFTRARRLRVENAGHNVLEAHPGVQSRLLSFFNGEDGLDETLTLPPPAFRRF